MLKNTFAKSNATVIKGRHLSSFWCVVCIFWTYISASKSSLQISTHVFGCFELRFSVATKKVKNREILYLGSTNILLLCKES